MHPTTVYSIGPSPASAAAEHSSQLLTSVGMFATPNDYAFFLSPPASSKANQDPDCDPDSENKENVSPYRDTTGSERTPSKPPGTLGAYPWRSGERAPLSDISQHFGKRRKKVEALGSAHLPQKALHFTPQSEGLSPPEDTDCGSRSGSGSGSGSKDRLCAFKAFR